MRRRTAALLVVAAAAIALTLVSLPLPATGASTTLHLLSGAALVGPTSDQLTPAVDGQIVGPGHEIRTLGDGYALLTFVDGSTLTIDPDTHLRVEEVSLRPLSTSIRVAQSLGRTWSSVNQLASPASRYEVRTPAITATVRGTAFEVVVTPEGRTLVRTGDGAVSVANDLGEVLVPAGTETTTAPAEPPQAPAPVPPSTSRSVEIGTAAVVVVDSAGRSCGRTDRGVVQQIPGCVVRGGSIEITGGAATAALSVVAAGPAASQAPARVTERVVGPGSTASTVVREVEVTRTGTSRVVVLTPRPPAGAPASGEVRTPEPRGGGREERTEEPLPSASATEGAGLGVPRFTLPPVPTFTIEERGPGGSSETSTPSPTRTPRTDPPAPTPPQETAQPKATVPATASPAETPRPKDTLKPTDTPKPSPTPTARPSATPDRTNPAPTRKP